MAKQPKSREFRVFAADCDRVLQRASAQQAEIYERSGIWRREYDGVTGAHIGFRVIGREMRRVDMDLRTMQTPATLTKAAIETIAGCRGSSHTAHLSEADRLERVRNGRAPEDQIERDLAKFEVYPFVGAAQGDILRAWPK